MPLLKDLINQTLKGWRYSSVRKTTIQHEQALSLNAQHHKTPQKPRFLTVDFNCKEIISLFFNSFFSDSLEQMVIFQQVKITLYSSQGM